MKNFTFAAALMPVFLAGCLSTTGPGGTLDSASAMPFVEATIEYAGVQAKWAGPGSFLLHVTAKGASNADIQVMHEILKEDAGPTVVNRKLASAAAISSENARETLGMLGESLEAEAAPVVGCLSPLRVRLIREDGSLVERSGCRSGTGWPALTSQVANWFMSSSGGKFSAK